MSRPPWTGRRKCAWSECSRLLGGASPHAALIVRASPTPPKTTGPHQSGVRPTHVSPCRSCRSRSRNSSTAACCCAARSVTSAPPELRSEEHTSELQSHSDLVCRLLLEKKKRRSMGARRRRRGGGHICG